MLIASGIFIAQRLNSRNQQSFPNYMTMMCHLHCWSPQCLQEMQQIDFNIAFMLARVVLLSCSLQRHSLARRNCQQNTKKTSIHRLLIIYFILCAHRSTTNWIGFQENHAKLQLYQCNYVVHSAKMSIVFSPLTWLCI